MDRELSLKIIEGIKEAERLKKIPAFSYERISSEMQTDGLSLDYQQDNAAFYAKTKNLHLVNTFNIVESAKKQGRKVFNNMIELAFQFNVKNLIFKSTDRMSRNYHDMDRVERLIDSDDFIIHFYQTNRTLTKNSSYDERMILGMEVTVAKHLVQKISHDVKAANEYKANKGIAPGRSPYGYIYDKKEKVHLIDSQTENTFRFIFDEFDTGKYSLTQFCELLNDQGYKTKTGRQWTKNNLHTLLTNPFYHGEFFFQNKIWPGQHKGYYDKERYNARVERFGNKFVGKKKGR